MSSCFDDRWLGVRCRRLAALVLGLTLALPMAIAGAVPDDDGGMTIAINKAELLRLPRDAAIVLVADPNVVDVAIESPRLVFLFGKLPGETNIFVLDKKGEAIIQTDIVVLPTARSHVTVDRGVVEATYSCTPRCAAIPTPTAVNPDQAAAAATSGGTTATTTTTTTAGGSSGTGTTGATSSSGASSDQAVSDIASQAAQAAIEALGLPSTSEK